MSSPRVCINCETAKAVCWCEQCSSTGGTIVLLCESCWTSVHNTKITSTHIHNTTIPSDHLLIQLDNFHQELKDSIAKINAALDARQTELLNLSKSAVFSQSATAANSSSSSSSTTTAPDVMMNATYRLQKVLKAIHSLGLVEIPPPSTCCQPQQSPNRIGHGHGALSITSPPPTTTTTTTLREEPEIVITPKIDSVVAASAAASPSPSLSSPKANKKGSKRSDLTTSAPPWIQEGETLFSMATKGAITTSSSTEESNGSETQSLLHHSDDGKKEKKVQFQHQHQHQ